MQARHATTAALAATLALGLAAPAQATGRQASTSTPSATSSTTQTQAGFTDVMRFGSVLKGTPLAMTSPTSNTVFTVIKRSTGVPEIKQVLVDGSGKVITSPVWALEGPWTTDWADAQIDGTAANDVWAVVNGRVWHADGQGVTENSSCPPACAPPPWRT